MENIMDKQAVKNIMGFMMRVQLTGSEVPAFNEAMRALGDEVNREVAEKLEDI